MKVQTLFRVRLSISKHLFTVVKLSVITANLKEGKASLSSDVLIFLLSKCSKEKICPSLLLRYFKVLTGIFTSQISSDDIAAIPMGRSGFNNPT